MNKLVRFILTFLTFVTLVGIAFVAINNACNIVDFGDFELLVDILVRCLPLVLLAMFALCGSSAKWFKVVLVLLVIVSVAVIIISEVKPEWFESIFNA